MKLGTFEKYQAQAPETIQLPPNYFKIGKKPQSIG